MEKETVEQSQQIFTVYYVLGTVLGIGDTEVTKQTGPPAFMWKKNHQENISMSRIISDSDKYYEEHGIS